MFDHDFCEYAVLKKKEGAYSAKIWAAAILSLVFAVCFFLFILPAAGFAAGLIIFAAVCAVLWYFSRYTYIEYEYCIAGGVMSFASVYSKQYRKENASIELKKQVRRVAPYNGNFDEFNVKSVEDMRSSALAPNSYYIVYEDDGLKAILFDATDKSADALFHQIPSLVVRDANLYQH